MSTAYQRFYGIRGPKRQRNDVRDRMNQQIEREKEQQERYAAQATEGKHTTSSPRYAGLEPYKPEPTSVLMGTPVARSIKIEAVYVPRQWRAPTYREERIRKPGERDLDIGTEQPAAQPRMKGRELDL